MRSSALENDLYQCIRLSKLPEPEREYRFCDRMFRFDFAWPDKKVAVECEGGTFVRGAHVRGAHYESDCRKGNLALLLGWRVFRFTRAMVESWEATRVLREVLKSD